MRAYIFATAAALLMAAPALAQPTYSGSSGGTEPNPQTTPQTTRPYNAPTRSYNYNGPNNPEQAQVPPGGQPYSEQLNKGSKNGPMNEQPNQNNRDVNRPDTNLPHTYGTPGAPR